MCCVGIQVSYMPGKLLKRRIFWCKLFWVNSYSVGTGNFLDTWSKTWPISLHRLLICFEWITLFLSMMQRRWFLWDKITGLLPQIGFAQIHEYQIWLSSDARKIIGGIFFLFVNWISKWQNTLDREEIAPWAEMADLVPWPRKSSCEAIVFSSFIKWKIYGKILDIAVLANSLYWVGYTCGARPTDLG
jgi:hypothetical protein